MLKEAIKAQLPLVTVYSRDVLNLGYLVKHMTGKTIVQFHLGQADQTSLVKGKVYWCEPSKQSYAGTKWNAVANKFAADDATLIVVNPPEIHQAFFDAGEALVPKDLLVKYFTAYGDGQALANVAGSLTIKEASDLIRLTSAEFGSMTPDGLSKMRKRALSDQKGLTLTPTEQGFYKPDPVLKEWVEKQEPWFLGPNVDARLRPRGLLFDGIPGTGKSSAAKWIAHQWGVPLFRLDLGDTKSKWVGESEAQLSRNLSRLDNEEPAVVLIDEIEKAMAFQSDHGTSTSMLGSLLWWLAEHRSRIFTVMTTNKKAKLPPELYREGRIDDVMVFGPLEDDELPEFVSAVCADFGIEMKGAFFHQVMSANTEKEPTPAHLKKLVMEMIKFGKAN